MNFGKIHAMTVAARPKPVPKDHRPRPTLPVRRFSISEYHILAKEGILGAKDRVELIDGWIVPKMTLYPPHSATVVRLTRWFNRNTPIDWSVRPQQPVTLLGDNEPEPDLVIATKSDDAYNAVHPGRREIALVIEVADSSLEIDRTAKLELYARNGLPEYWIVNLPESCFEIYTRPSRGRSPTYRSQVISNRKQNIDVVLKKRHLGKLSIGAILP